MLSTSVVRSCGIQRFLPCNFVDQFLTISRRPTSLARNDGPSPLHHRKCVDRLGVDTTATERASGLTTEISRTGKAIAIDNKVDVAPRTNVQQCLNDWLWELARRRKDHQWHIGRFHGRSKFVGCMIFWQGSDPRIRK